MSLIIIMIFVISIANSVIATNVINTTSGVIGEFNFSPEMMDIKPLNVASISDTEHVFKEQQIYVHDNIRYIKGESKGNFMLTGYCSCEKCSGGNKITYSGKPVRENHTIAADRKVLPIGTVIILENAKGKDGTLYDGVYVVEDIGGGVKNNHIDIYRPTHELASLVTHYGRAYGDVYIAIPIDTDPVFK